MVDTLLESVKAESNTDIKHEIVDDYSFKSENEVDNYSDEPYTAPKSKKLQLKCLNNIFLCLD